MDEVEKKLTVKVAAGLGNQMFMYANALALSKIYGYKLFIDNKSCLDGFTLEISNSKYKGYKTTKFDY